MYRLATLLCLIALAWAAPVAAQTPIHRCIGANGSAVFTDQPCAALQATPASRVAASAPAVTATTTPTLCAATLGALRQGVIDVLPLDLAAWASVRLGRTIEVVGSTPAQRQAVADGIGARGGIAEAGPGGGRLLLRWKVEPVTAP